LKKLNINIEEAIEVPFQAQIHYTTPEGHKFMRVITHVQKITKNIDLAEKNADMKILHFAAAQKTSNYARGGNYEVSRKYNKNWSNYLAGNTNMNMKSSNFVHNEMMQKQQKVLRGAIVNKEKKIEKKFGKGSDSDSDNENPNNMEIEKNLKEDSSDSENEEKGEKKCALTQKNKELFLSKVAEKEEEEEENAARGKKSKKKKMKRKLSCSSGSERMVNSDDEGEAVMIQMKKGML